jgi:hypothetical protein
VIDEGDGDFQLVAEETVESLIALCDEQCAASREVMARFPPDQSFPIRTSIASPCGGCWST